MQAHSYKFKGKIWLWPGKAAWHFVSLPKKLSSQIKKTYGDLARGWGSFPVKAKIHNTEWDTSIFPDKKTQTYLLPLKASTRKQAKVAEGDQITVELIIKI